MATKKKVSKKAPKVAEVRTARVKEAPKKQSGQPKEKVEKVPLALVTSQEIDLLGESAESGQFIHTVQFRIRVPEVVILRAFNGFVRQEIRFSRRNIFERDNPWASSCQEERSPGSHR
jgi:5-methylcytosine-specific restriction endonuclease McrA